MKKTKMIGVLCMMLVMWLGCTKDASAAANVDTACIFDEKIIELPSALGAVSDMQIAKGRICLRSEDGKMLYAGNLDGSKVKKVFSDKDSVKDYFRVFTLDQKGNLYLLKHKSDEKKGIIEEYVEKRDKTGKLVATIKLGRKYEEKRSIDFDAYGILVDKNNKIYVFSRHGIHVYDSRGSEYKGEGVEVFLNPFNRAFFSKDGKIIILFQSFEELIGTTYRVYNPQKGTVSKSRKMAVGEMAGQSMSYDRGFDFYTNTKTSLYGYSHKSGEKTELINWIDSGIDEWIYPGLIARVSDETLIAITYQYNEKEGKDCSKLCIFSRRDAGEIKKKKVITMVANSNQFELVKNIMDFNRTNADYQVKLIYDDKKSIEDLSSGDTPDIFCFFDDNEYNRMLSKGLFTDLYGIFNQDDDFNREEYLTNLFSGLENDGKLYRICPVFDYDTFLGKAKYFEAKKDWTLSEVEALASQQANPLPVFSKKLSREDILKTYTLFLLGKNIDYEKKSVSINHDELSKYLEQFKQHPKGWQGSSMDQEAKQAMLFDYNDPSFYEFHNLEKKICKDELAFVGFPGSEGSKSVFLPKMEFAISKDCKYKDEVWNFIKRFFQEDYQNSEEIMPYLPVKKNAIENRLKAVKRETGLTNLEIDQIMDFLTSLSCVGLDDKQINKIMQEEAERFYRGEQTANEAVSHIQDQIQQYIK